MVFVPAGLAKYESVFYQYHNSTMKSIHLDVLSLLPHACVLFHTHPPYTHTSHSLVQGQKNDRCEGGGAGGRARGTMDSTCGTCFPHTHTHTQVVNRCVGQVWLGGVTGAKKLTVPLM